MHDLPANVDVAILLTEDPPNVFALLFQQMSNVDLLSWILARERCVQLHKIGREIMFNENLLFLNPNYLQ